MSLRKGLDSLSQGISNIGLDSSEDGGWEEVKGKNKGKAGSSSGKQLLQHNPMPKAWGQADTAQRLGIRSSITSERGVSTESKLVTGPSAVPPGHPVLNWAGRTAPPQVIEEKAMKNKVDEGNNFSEEDEDDYSDDDDDYLLSDGSDSDEGPQSHEKMKKHRMLKKFFKSLDALSIEEMNGTERQWHCPACQNGPGAIDWYKGLQPLVVHARTKGTKRVKLHRTFANILEEELKIRGTSVVPAGESFGQWEGLKQEVKDHDIVWPPMVVIMNTLLEKDDKDMWTGMGNQELLDYFKGYAAVRAKHSYGPRGHRGLSVLIFDSTAVGYIEAERLHKHFLGQGTGRNAWETKGRALFYPGGKRQLYGFLARKEDLDEFNKHCPGKTRLKYDIRSYQEKVVIPMKQMSEENQQLNWFKNKSAKDQRQKKALEESLIIVSEKLRKTTKDNQEVRERTKKLQNENKEQMDFQEKFFKEQIEDIHHATNVKEDHFEKLQQEQQSKIEKSNKDDLPNRAEEVMALQQLQDEELGKFEAEREELIKGHEEKKLEMKKRHWKEEVEMEKEYNIAYTKLMDKYTPRLTEPATGTA